MAWVSVAAAMASSVSPQISWVAMGPSSCSGSSTDRSTLRRLPVSTTTQSGLPSASMCRLPTRKRAISDSGRWVADSPMRVTGSSESWHSRSTDKARWAPRLSSATA